MRHCFSILILLVMMVLLPAVALSADEQFHPQRLVVRFKEQPKSLIHYQTTGISIPSRIVSLFPHHNRQSLSAGRFEAPVYLFEYSSEQEREQAEIALQTDPTILYVERDYKIQLFHDPLFSNQWAMKNNGQKYLGIKRINGNQNDELVSKSGTAGADINYPEPIDQDNQRHKTILAIIDTGVDYYHPDLAGNIRINHAEIPGNGIDDDFNGFADDYYGYDFSGDSQGVFASYPDPNPSDQVGHGTHCAGIAAAVAGNGIGTEGIARDIQIMCLKMFPNAYSSVSSQAIIYAVENGARIINASWGSPYFSSIISDAVQFADDNGVLFVAAAGNTGEVTVFFPARYDYILTVGASTSSDQVTTFSTYGDWIDLVAPGLDILSLRAAGTDLYATMGEPDVRIIDSLYYLADGTSMAAPHVVGAAAYLLSVSPGLQLDSLKNLIVSSVDDYLDPFGDGSDLPGKDLFSGYGRLNLGRAVGFLSDSYVEIEQPPFNSIQSGTIVFEGSAYSAGSDSYHLEVKPASSGEWLTIASGAADLVRQSLVEWNSSEYDGRTLVRLSIGDENVFNSVVRLVNNQHVDISYPGQGDTVFSVTDIIGSASAPGFESYELSFYSDSAPKKKHLIIFSNKILFDSKLAEWTVGRITPGPGLLKLIVITNQEIIEESAHIEVKSLLSDGYPKGDDLWPHLTAVASNIDDDPEPEIVSGAHDHIIINHYSEQRLELLTTDFSTSYYSSPSLHDFDGDGKDEIVIVTDSGLTVLNAQGEHLPGWPRYITIGWSYNSYPTPLVTDLDGDGNMEILVVDWSGEIYCFRYNGNSYFHTTAGLFNTIDSTGRERVFGGATVPFLFAYDFNGDGYQDVGVLYTARGNYGGLYLYSGKNAQPLYPEIGYKVLSTSKIFGGLLADFDDDGLPEIAFTHYHHEYPGPMTVSIVESDGTPLDGWPKVFEKKVQWLSPFPAAADLDGDSVPELVCVFSAWDGGEVAIWKGDGTPWLENSLGTSDGLFASVVNSLASPLILDVDNDQEYEIVARGGALLIGSVELVFAWNLDGSLVKGWPAYTYSGLVTYSPYVPVAGDFDNDGLLELVMGSSEGKVYSWDLATVADESSIAWGSFLHDKRHTGILPFESRQRPVSESEHPKPQAEMIAQNYPNPFNTHTTIELDIGKEEHLSLDIFNLLGQKVVELYNDPVIAGRHRFGWDGHDHNGNRVASGVYFYRVKLGDITQTRKMLFLK